MVSSVSIRRHPELNELQRCCEAFSRPALCVGFEAPQRRRSANVFLMMLGKTRITGRQHGPFPVGKV